MRQTQKIHAYEYRGGNPHLHLHLKKEASWGAHHIAAFRTRHPTRYHENNTAYGEYFLSNGRVRRALYHLASRHASYLLPLVSCGRKKACPLSARMLYAIKAGAFLYISQYK